MDDLRQFHQQPKSDRDGAGNEPVEIPMPQTFRMVSSQIMRGISDF
jgi:hypothetical protein